MTNSDAPRNRPTIPIRVTLEVDPVAWSEEYGVRLDRAAVRADVLSYVRTSLDAAPVSIAVRRP